jgi:hypothetical protein
LLHLRVAPWKRAGFQGSTDDKEVEMSRKMAGSQRQLADDVGRSHSVVQRWLQREDWPFPKKPPWNIAEVRAWAAMTLGPNPADGSDEADATVSGNGAAGNGLDALRRQPLQASKLKLNLIRAAKLELEKDILAGEYLRRRDVETALVRRAYTVKAALQGIPRTLAHELAATSDENEIERRIQDAIDGALLELSQNPKLAPAPEETEGE